MDENRRDYPRIDTQFSADVRDPAGDVLTVSVINLSRTGLQVVCDRDTAQRIVGEPAWPVGDTFLLQLRLPFLWQKPADIVIDCRMIHATVKHGAGFQLGFLFSEFIEDGYQSLEAFIEECMCFPSSES